MNKIQTFCDFCNKEFTSTYWDEAPCIIALKLGGPAQAYESRYAEHVCNSCRKAIVSAWDKLIINQTPDE
jgi:hypothetical protein